MSTNYINQINALLDPVLFQVVGSTPTSVRDAIKGSALKNNPSDGAKIVTLCLFASAVNKATMESFLVKPNMTDVRPVVSSSFAVSGKPNMTALTLLGHCLMLTDVASNIDFVRQYRNKLGQNDIWSGSLDKGSISTKQKEILLEKQRVIKRDEAALLGRCFLKFTGLDPNKMSRQEATFWDGSTSFSGAASGSQTSSSSGSGPNPFQTPDRPFPSSSGSASGSPPSQVDRSNLDLGAGKDTVTLRDGTIVEVPSNLVLYYRTCVADNVQRLTASIASRGVDRWVADYSAQLLADPDMQRRPSGGSSVVG
jgi:hypothetical protein